MTCNILGIGTVSALGCGIDTLKGGLEGTHSPRLVPHEIRTRKGDVTLPVYTAEPEGLDRFIPRARYRRMDRFLQMGLLASFLALEDAGVVPADKARIGIVFGTGYGLMASSFGFFDALFDEGDKCAPPTLFANSVHNALASNVSIALGIEGPSQTITCFDMTTSAVFDLAGAWIEGGIVDYVLAGVGDEYCPPRGYSVALAGSDGREPLAPFDFDRCTYLPGEGYAAFLLGKGDGYARIDRAGRLVDAQSLGGDLDLLILSASGERGAGTHYGSFMKAAPRVSAYAPLYGGMPAGQGFDVAIAALSLKAGYLYPSPSGEPAAGIPIKTDGPFRIGALQCDMDGNAGIVALSKD